jgi:hypothetical protein
VLVPDVRTVFEDAAHAGRAVDLPPIPSGIESLAVWTAADGSPALLVRYDGLAAWSPGRGTIRLRPRRDPETVLEWLGKQPTTLVQFLTGVEK